ncbi:MAG: aminomethyl-transferring glycine dehydrogenase subunit GcvPB [Proteobacteria bacterium]|nr:aminomethyl-transferring glycine dehydrogenase subunit GcvPB [Pseudomonadota bacterium]
MSHDAENNIIFEKSQPNRFAFAQVPQAANITLDNNLLRQDTPILPGLSELEVVRHFTRLSQQNYCIDTHFYPLGSCTMKYNPRGVQRLAMMAPFWNHHPLTLPAFSQGILQCLFELQEYLKSITGMSAVCLSPMAGAQGEFAGCAMIKAYHRDKGDTDRIEMLIPDGAHGTNPATAAMCGFKIKQIPTTAKGDIDLEILNKVVGPKTAGIMLTNPSTLGVFERNIIEVAQIVHRAGGLLYYDGANLNAILGKVRPGDMGFDVMHMNMHKTFATPHGGGGPGSGPLAANERLKDYLPIPMVVKRKQDMEYDWLALADCPKSIGRLSTFMGNVGILLRAYIYIRMLGEQGLKRIADYATLNANYLMKELQRIGFTPAYPGRHATHEFIITLAKEAKYHGITALDLAKALLDYGFYAPTIYFPTLISECLLIEPTETESKQTLDAFIEAMREIYACILNSPEKLLNAPSRLPCKRLDEVKAARELDLVWHPNK